MWIYSAWHLQECNYCLNWELPVLDLLCYTFKLITVTYIPYCVSFLFWAFIYFHHILASDPPVIIPIDFGGTDLYEEGIASATCVVSQGSLPLMVTWTYNGKLLRNDKYRKIHNFGKRTSILTIEPLSHLHQGVYGCVASNTAGTYKVEADLVIHGKMNIGSRILVACLQCDSNLTCDVPWGSEPALSWWTPQEMQW